jgi:hypothetical protein
MLLPVHAGGVRGSLCAGGHTGGECVGSQPCLLRRRLLKRERVLENTVGGGEQAPPLPCRCWRWQACSHSEGLLVNVSSAAVESKHLSTVSTEERHQRSVGDVS